MVKLKIDDIEYEIPSFISIKNYSKIYKVKELFTDQYFAAKLINTVTDIPLSELKTYDYQHVNYIAAYILSLIPMEKNVPFVDRFTIDGINYGFFPNWKDLTYAEFADMDTISTKPANELLDLLHILAAIMYRPIEYEISEHNFLIEEYDLEKMKKRAEIFKEKLDIKILLGAQFFFIKFAKKFSLYSQASSIQTFSIWTKMKILWSMRKIILPIAFKRRMVGSLSSTELLEMILQNTTISTKRK